MEASVKNKRGNLPSKESDLNYRSTEVATYWATRSNMQLNWTSPAELLEAAGTFGSSFAERKDVKANRRELTQKLKKKNLEIDHSVMQTKNYLADIYSKSEAIVHYESLGIIKIGKVYRLPMDNESRLYALDQLLKGIDKHGLADRKFGKAYWTEMRSSFAEIKSQAETADRNTSEHVGIKGEQIKYIRKTLNALIHLIKAQYPDTWREELRVWGFLKEKY
jgi:hypothetical protein